MSDLLKNLKANPGSTAAELGATAAEMKQLEAEGKVVNVGTRRTGKRGKPPAEWAVAGAEANKLKQANEEAKKAAEEAKIKEAQENAPKVVELPNIDDVFEILENQNTWEARQDINQLEYIIKELNRGREQGDITILRARFDDIARLTRRQARKVVEVPEEV